MRAIVELIEQRGLERPSLALPKMGQDGAFLAHFRHMCGAGGGN
jgi:hypothetical protein